MGRRTDLHEELKGLLGTNNCYFQPPESVKLKYPCYVYHRSAPDLLRADDEIYHRFHKYSLTYITPDPDDPLIEETEDHFKYCKMVRHFVADYLNHYNYDLYY